MSEQSTGPSHGNNKPSSGNRWLIVVGALLIQLCLGAIYAWGAFTVALQNRRADVALALSPELLGVIGVALRAPKVAVTKVDVAHATESKRQRVVEGKRERGKVKKAEPVEVA